MIDLNEILLRRAEEQVAGDKLPPGGRDMWAIGGASKERECAVPGCTGIVVVGPGASRLCPTCRAAGLSTMPCKGCGGPTRRFDRNGVHSRERRGYCHTCRAEMPQVHRGAETIVKARAAKARRAS